MAFDLDSRNPCFDDACVGILDASGRCGTCGRQASDEQLAGLGAAAGAVPAPDGADDPDSDSDSGAEAAADPAPGTGADPGEGEAEPGEGFDPGRRLCPDGACIGVIGADDRCKVCGTPAV